MEYGDASGTGLLDVREKKWCEPLIEFIDPDLADALPPLASSRRAFGLLRENLREAWGLSKGEVTVSAGGGDNMMGAIGTGNVQPGVVTVSLGTSRHGLRLCRQAGHRSAGRSRRVLRQHGSLAAAGLHDECDRRHRAGAQDVRLVARAARRRTSPTRPPARTACFSSRT